MSDVWRGRAAPWEEQRTAGSSDARPILAAPREDTGTGRLRRPDEIQMRHRSRAGKKEVSGKVGAFSRDARGGVG